ncbi:MAG: nucleotidyltransferase family protein [bacterium]
MMKNKTQNDIPYKQIAKFCQKWDIYEFSLFGSILRRDFREDSDIDVLITFAPESKYGLFDLVHMQEELKKIFGRKVDLITRRGIETSRNYIRRNAILNTAKVIHAAR